jgi:hypothetical protein
VKTVVAIAVIVVVVLPSVWAGDPATAPGWFRQDPAAALPTVVLVVAGMMIALVILAGICSAIAARDQSSAGGTDP